MNNQISIQNILNQKLIEMRLKNPSFSIRALAKRIGLQPSATNEILKGKRRISLKLAEKIADRMLLDPTERMNFLKDFTQKLTRRSKFKEGKSKELGEMKLNSQQFDLIADWTYFAILNLMETRDFISRPDVMAKRLGIPLKKVQENLKTLKELNLIKLEEGIWKRTYLKTNTSDDVINLSLQRMHIEDMEMAKEKILSVDVKERDFTSYTLAFDLSLLPKVKEMIRKLQDDVDELMQEGIPTEVYKINTYLYPLTSKVQTSLKETENENNI